MRAVKAGAQFAQVRPYLIAAAVLLLYLVSFLLPVIELCILQCQDISLLEIAYKSTTNLGNTTDLANILRVLLFWTIIVLPVVGIGQVFFGRTKPALYVASCAVAVYLAIAIFALSVSQMNDLKIGFRIWILSGIGLGLIALLMARSGVSRT